MMQDDPARRHTAQSTRLLGFAGLLPQFACLIALGQAGLAPLAAFAALIYGALILSFLGGIWWGIAMRRKEGQAALALLAVVPSLAAFALVGAAGILGVRRGLVALGVAIILTLLVDRRLSDNQETPEDWMRLRVPLSLGLGALTIIAGVLAPA